MLSWMLACAPGEQAAGATGKNLAETCPDTEFSAFLDAFYSAVDDAGSSLDFIETQRLHEMLDNKPCAYGTRAYTAWLDQHQRLVDGAESYIDYGEEQRINMSQEAAPDAAGPGAWGVWFDWLVVRLLEMGDIEQSEQQVLDVVAMAEPEPDVDGFAVFFPGYLEVLDSAGVSLQPHEEQALDVIKAFHIPGAIEADYLSWLEAFQHKVEDMFSTIEAPEGELLDELLTVKPCVNLPEEDSNAAYRAMSEMMPASGAQWLAQAGPSCD